MTNYNKWDSYVAQLSLTSSDEEDEPARSQTANGPGAAAAPVSAGKDDGEKKYGWGKPLDERGQIDRTGELTVGNAKGNALSTNAAPQKVFRITEWHWEQSDDDVTIELDVTKARERCVSGGENHFGFSQDRVKATMQENEVEIRCYDRDNKWELAFGLNQLPGIDPQKSSFSLTSSKAAASKEDSRKDSFQRIVISLAKRSKQKRWETCGKEKTFLERKLPVVSVDKYSWSDSEQHVTVFLKIPGVHLVEASCIRVRYRELSFDVSCVVDGKDFRFAVTELPMEIEVTKCRHRVKENELRVVLRKWARCTWFKLQVHRS